MTEIPSQTASLCPHCLRRIPAQRVVEKDAVYLKKRCPEHGDLGKVLLWRDFPRPYDEWNRTLRSDRPISPEDLNGCPYECGLCKNHRQETCTAILEVTHRCNLNCPVCFADSGMNTEIDPDLGQIVSILEATRDQSGLCPIQLSGGEPTLRDDLPQIVSLTRKLGFDHIQINTNGIRLAGDADFGRELLDAGATVIYLQFDGISDDVYRNIRGTDLLPLKMKAIERCAELKIGLILVPTLVKGINDHQIGSIIQFAKDWMPIVKGVHFQPMTFLGRYPVPPSNADRLLLSDILAAIENQTGGELRVENLLPSG